jgi:enoyl-CoA hydratase/carnithine racemase
MDNETSLRLMGKPRKVSMSPLLNYNTLDVSLEKSTKSLNVELIFVAEKEFFSKEMIFELESLFNWLTGHLEIQTVFIKSSTNHFAKGLNLKSYMQSEQRDDDINQRINSAFSKIRSFNRAMMLLPQIFILDYGKGANGCGFEFGIGADLRVANKSSTMSLCPLEKGLLPMSGGISFLALQITPSFCKKWNFLPTITNNDLINSGYISLMYENTEEVNSLIKQMYLYSPAARIQTKGCMLQGQLDHIDKVFSDESNYGLPLLVMNDWKKSYANDETKEKFQSITDLASILTEHKSEIYEEL